MCVYAVKQRGVCVHRCDLDINMKGLNHILLKKIKMGSWTLIIAVLDSDPISYLLK